MGLHRYLSDNPYIARYRGNTGLFAEIGYDDGLRISATSRLSLASGRGALKVEASFPLSRLIGPSLNLYVFGQGFVGCCENLLDYNRQALVWSLSGKRADQMFDGSCTPIDQCDTSAHRVGARNRSRVTPPSAHSRSRLCPYAPATVRSASVI